MTWGANEGAPTRILAIKQTKDGYLWLGTAEGLFRFDGLAFQRYREQSRPALPPGPVDSLLTVPNGDLWIGFGSGKISRLRNGHALSFGIREGLSESPVSCLAQDASGTIWASSADGLMRLENGRWRRVGKRWKFPGAVARALFVDRTGTLWVATEKTIVFLPKGAREFHTTGINVGIVAQITQAPNEKLWMAETTRSIRPVPLHTMLAPPNSTEIRVGSQGIIFSQSGNLWIATLGNGLLRVPKPEDLKGPVSERSRFVENYTVANGLSNDLAISIFEGRDGNIWVGTDSGLDLFRKTAITAIHAPIKLVNADLVSGNNGDIWIFSPGGNVRIRNSQIYTGAKTFLPKGNVVGAYRAPNGNIWWVLWHAIVLDDNGRFTRYPLPRGIEIRGHNVEITGGRSGLLWIYLDGEGLYSWKKGKWNKFSLPAELEGMKATAAFTDGQGRAWFGGGKGSIFYMNGRQIHIAATRRNAPVGGIRAIQGHNGYVWFGGKRGLVYYRNEFYAVDPRGKDSFEAVSGIQETRNDSLWLLEHRGVIRISADEIRKFLARPQHHVKYEIFDSEDGLPGRIDNRIGQNEIQDTTGRLWFGATDGIVWLDPQRQWGEHKVHFPFIQSVVADGQSYLPSTGLKLSPGIKDLQIGYKSINLTYPRRTYYLYKLDRVDRQWQNVGHRRTAYYTNLHPGKYRFHVIACNEEGLCNHDQAVLTFTIPPFWFQTMWFQLLCGIILLSLMWVLYQFRMRQLKHQFMLTMGARVDERVRIARELHDTLLQSLHGLMFQFQVARNLLPRRPESAMQTLDEALLATEQALTEGRDAIQDLRPQSTTDHDLPELMNAAGHELADAIGSSGYAPSFRMIVEGKPRRLSFVLQNELYRIGREVIRNAFQHAAARHIEVEIRYDERELRLRVRDDGKGIDPAILRTGGSPGHWGLPGIKERAQRIGARLEFWSEAEAGTEIELRVPAVVAYEKEQVIRRGWLFRRRRRQ